MRRHLISDFTACLYRGSKLCLEIYHIDIGWNLEIKVNFHVSYRYIVFISGKQSQVVFTTISTKLNLKDIVDNGNSYTFGVLVCGPNDIWIIKHNKHVFIQMICNVNVIINVSQ